MFIYQEKNDLPLLPILLKDQNFFLITLNKGHLPTEVNIMFASISFDL